MPSDECWPLSKVGSGIDVAIFEEAILLTFREFEASRFVSEYVVCTRFYDVVSNVAGVEL